MIDFSLNAELLILALVLMPAFELVCAILPIYLHAILQLLIDSGLFYLGLIVTFLPPSNYLHQVLLQQSQPLVLGN